MEFQYTIDPSADRPILLLDDEIGYDEETGEGIPADKFCRELLFLDTLGKSAIDIWINSPGGNVLDGMQIFNTILKTKTNIDTHNVGMAASITAPIFLSGRHRYMMDNAVLMVHPLSGGDDQSRKVFEGCVNTMISSRSFLKPETVKGLMDATTWLNAHECEAMGLCEKEYSADYNKQRSKPDLTNVSKAHKIYRQLTNSAIKNLKPIIMTKVTNKLKLVDGSNEDAQLAAIEAIENKATTAENKATKLGTDLAASEAKYLDLENKFNILTKEVSDAKEAAKAATVNALKNTAKTEIAAAVKAGKLASDVKNIEMWEEDYVADPARTKAKIDAIPLNKKAAVISTEGGVNNDTLTMGAAIAMSDLRNKLKI